MSQIAAPPVQRKLVGALANAKREHAHKGLRKYNENVTYKSAQDHLVTLQDLDADVESWEQAAILLWPDSPTAEKARAALAKIARQQAAEQAQNALSDKVKDLYPDSTGSKVYRGDNRTWAEIFAPDSEGQQIGFRAKNPLSIAEARTQARNWFKSGADPRALHQQWIANPAHAGGDKIATGTELNCMGYGIADPMSGANANVYMIDTPGLKVVENLTEQVLGTAPIQPLSYKVGPKLLLDADTVEQATIIAVRGAGNAAGETTFFTAIKPAWITLIYEATQFEEGAEVTPSREENRKKREKTGRWTNPDVDALHRSARAAVDEI